MCTWAGIHRARDTHDRSTRPESPLPRFTQRIDRRAFQHVPLAISVAVERRSVMPLAHAQHHTVLGFIVQRIKRLKRKTAHRVQRIGRKRRRAHHAHDKRQGVGKSRADQGRVHAHVVRLHIGAALHAKAIQGVAVFATAEAAGPALNQFAQQRGVAVALNRICG